MSATPIPIISANTPFLQGVPNSLVSREWYLALVSLVQVGNTTQPIDDQSGDIIFDDALLPGVVDATSARALDLATELTTVPSDDAQAAIATQQAIDQLQQMLEEAQDSTAKAMAALQDALIEYHMIVDVIRSMAQQDAANVAITGGAISGTSVAATSLTASGGFGCNGKSAQTSVTLPANATDLASVITLANAMKAALIANGVGA